MQCPLPFLNRNAYLCTQSKKPMEQKFSNNSIDLQVLREFNFFFLCS